MPIRRISNLCIVSRKKALRITLFQHSNLLSSLVLLKYFFSNASSVCEHISKCIVLKGKRNMCRDKFVGRLVPCKISCWKIWHVFNARRVVKLYTNYNDILWMTGFKLLSLNKLFLH